MSFSLLVAPLATGTCSGSLEKEEMKECALMSHSPWAFNRSTLVPLVMSRTVNLQLSEPSREFRPLDSRTSWNEILPSSSVTPMPRYVVGMLIESKYVVVERTRRDEGCVKDHRQKIIFTGGNVVVVAKAEPQCFSWLSSMQEL